jgi:hypothetical protein
MPLISNTPETRRVRENQTQLAKRFGITQFEFREPGLSIKTIGFSPSRRKWYGWSHRAVAGFGIGDTIPRAQFPDSPDARKDPGKSGAKITSLSMAKQTAAAFAAEVA